MHNKTCCKIYIKEMKDAETRSKQSYASEVKELRLSAIYIYKYTKICIRLNTEYIRENIIQCSMYVCVCVCMYVHTYVWICVHKCKYQCIYVCTHVRMYVYMCVCTYVCVNVCMYYVCLYVCTCVYVWMYVHKYVWVYVCMYTDTTQLTVTYIAVCQCRILMFVTPHHLT
jgi:hypothetical protein